MEKTKQLKQTIEDFDLEIITGLEKLRTKIGNYFWKFWTHAGYPWPWVTVALIFSIIYDDYHVAYVLIFAAISSLIVIFPIKMYFKRTRPYDKHDELKPLTRADEPWSFPSGHTYYATVNGVSLALCYGGAISLFLMCGLGILVGVSRLYLGVHYFTDVVAAYFLGIGAAYVVYLCFPLIMVLHNLT